MDANTELLFREFKQKNTVLYVQSLYRLNDPYKPSKITRLTDYSDNRICSLCKKKALYTNNSNNQILCWKHGIEYTKNN